MRYELYPGDVYVVDEIRYTVSDPQIAIILEDNQVHSLLKKGINLDAGILDSERTRITELLHKHGYYSFNKDYISYVADTVNLSYEAGLNVIVAGEGSDAEGNPNPHTQYYLSDIDYYLMDTPNFSSDRDDTLKTIDYKGFRLFYPYDEEKPLLRPSVLDSHSFLREGMLYNTDSVSKTYSSLSRLGILRYTNIRFEPLPGTADRLKTNVYLVNLPKHSFSFEMEGTNTAGDLGAAASVSFMNRNLFRGSEQFTLKLRGAIRINNQSARLFRRYLSGIRT